MTNESAESLVLLDVPVPIIHQMRIAELAAKYQLPTMFLGGRRMSDARSGAGFAPPFRGGSAINWPPEQVQAGVGGEAILGPGAAALQVRYVECSSLLAPALSCRVLRAGPHLGALQGSRNL